MIEDYELFPQHIRNRRTNAATREKTLAQCADLVRKRYSKALRLRP